MANLAIPDAPPEVFDSNEKGEEESWYVGRRLMNFPAPFKAIFTGMTSAGKTSMIKNLIVRQDPDFDVVYIKSLDPECREYSDMLESPAAHILEDIPRLDDLVREGKKLLILEDLSFNKLTSEQKDVLQELFTHVSSHRNLSIIITCHNFYDLPTTIRRTAHLKVLFKQNDPKFMRQLCTATGFPINKLEELSPLGYYDSLWVDETRGSPAPFRLNGYKPI